MPPSHLALILRGETALGSFRYVHAVVLSDVQGGEVQVRRVELTEEDEEAMEDAKRRRAKDSLTHKR